MTDEDRLAERFEEHRPRLEGVAQRILGSASEAEDAVQETWLRLSRTDAGEIGNLGGWLTVVLSRVCLNALEARKTRSALSLDAEEAPEPEAQAATAPDPEQEAVLADTVGLAMLVVLDQLAPAERVAFVLHDMFGVSFEEIAPVVGRSVPAARQLASRARRRVRGRGPGALDPEADRMRQARLVDAFLAAAREGDFDGLLAVLDPDVVLTADATAAAMGAEQELRGALDVARFSRRARGATPALADGDAAVAWVVDDRPRVVYRFTTRGDRITGVELIADPERIDALDLVIADGPPPG